MNFLGRCIEYLKDNPEGYWFKRKCFGWGWTPATWQGWLVTVLVIVFVFWRAVVFEQTVGAAEPTPEQLYSFFAQVIGAIAVLLIICWRTGEKPKWQWGVPKKKDSSNENSR